MASVPPKEPNRIDPQTPPERPQPPTPAAPPAIPETEPCLPDVDDPDRCPEEWVPEQNPSPDTAWTNATAGSNSLNKVIRILPRMTAVPVSRGANLIARNLAYHGLAEAAEETAGHIRQYRAPSLRAVQFELAASHPERFPLIATEAASQLRDRPSRRSEAPGA